MTLLIALLWALWSADVLAGRGSGGGAGSASGSDVGAAHSPDPVDAGVQANTENASPESEVAGKSEDSTTNSPGKAAATAAEDAKPSQPEAEAAPAESPPPPPLQLIVELQQPDKPAGQSAGSGKASIFEGAGTDTKFVYVVDRSGSMNGDRLEAAKGELIKAIENLPENAEFYVIFFDNLCDSMPAPSLLPAKQEHKEQIIRWIQQIFARGGTEPACAMEKALALKPQTIWLLSDGVFSDYNCQLISRWNPGRNIAINTIAFHDMSGEPVLKRIAAENRGDYRFIPATGSGNQPNIPSSLRKRP